MSILLFIVMLIIIAQDNLINILKIPFLTNFDEILIIFMIILFIISLRKKKISFFSIKMIVLLMGFMMIGVFSCYINSSFELKNVAMSCFLSTKFWIIVISCSMINFNKKFIDNFYKYLFIIEKIVLFFAFFNILFLSYYKQLFPISFVTYRFNFISVCSIFIHPGKYGWFMLFCAIAHLSLYVCDKNKKELWKMVVAIIACLFSFRTKVIISAVMCIGCYLLYINRESLKKQMKKILVFTIFIMLFIFPFKNIILNTYTLYFTDTEGYSVRQALLDNSFKIAKEYFPIGVGFGKYGTLYAAKNYSEYYFKYGMSNMYGITRNNTSYSTDTFWPAVIGETGFIGTLIYILLVILLLKRMIIIYNEVSIENKSITILSLLIFIQILIESFGSASFNSPPTYFFTSFVIGLALSVNRKGYDEIETKKS